MIDTWSGIKETYPSMSRFTCKPAGAAAEDLSHVLTKITGHKTIHGGIQCAIRVSQKQAIGDSIVPPFRFSVLCPPHTCKTIFVSKFRRFDF